MRHASDPLRPRRTYASERAACEIGSADLQRRATTAPAAVQHLRVSSPSCAHRAGVLARRIVPCWRTRVRCQRAGVRCGWSLLGPSRGQALQGCGVRGSDRQAPRRCASTVAQVSSRRQAQGRQVRRDRAVTESRAHRQCAGVCDTAMLARCRRRQPCASARRGRLRHRQCHRKINARTRRGDEFSGAGRGTRPRIMPERFERAGESVQRRTD